MVNMIKIGCLGPDGTFSRFATDRWMQFIHLDAELVFFSSIPSIIDAVESSDIQLGVVPVENTIEGPVNAAHDAMVQTKSTQIRAEFLIPVGLDLFAKTPLDLADITDVASHPQPLAQCQQFIQDQLPKTVRLHVAPSTAFAANQLAKSYSFSMESILDTSAVIGGRWLGGMFDLCQIAEGIQDMKENQTRFWVIGREVPLPVSTIKTSVVFSLPQNKPGGLATALGVFGKHGINLTSIGSRPTKTGLGHYLFFVDAEHNHSEMSLALSELEGVAAHMRHLGTYPFFQEI